MFYYILTFNFPNPVRQRLIDERAEREQVEAENTKLKNHLNELNTKLSYTSGESQNALEELASLKAEHQKLNASLKEVESEKSAALEEKDQLQESTQKEIEELKLKIKELYVYHVSLYLWIVFYSRRRKMRFFQNRLFF